MTQHHRMERRTTLTLSTVLTRGGVILTAAVVLSALAGAVSTAERTTEMSATTSTKVVTDSALRAELDAAQSALTIERLKLRRSNAVLAYSAQYRIPADLSAAIYDHAVTEGIEPQVAFRLVKVESNFMPKAKSRANAIGYTQLQLATAREYEPWVSEKDLHTRDVNLRIGFRFLKDLMRRYGGDEQIALLAYNRGPARVNEYLEGGVDPDNGYPAAVLRAGQ
jgi:soluble lytic murein transglycosylase-like protein